MSTDSDISEVEDATVQESNDDKVQEVDTDTVHPLEVRVVNNTKNPKTIYDSSLEEMYDDLKAEDMRVLEEDSKDG